MDQDHYEMASREENGRHILKIAEEALNDAEKYSGDKIVFSNRALHILWKYYTHVSAAGIPSVDDKAFTNVVRRLIEQADKVKSLEYKLMFVGMALKYIHKQNYHLNRSIRWTLIECLRKEVSQEVFVDLALTYIEGR
ncbi:MAG: hypothetical protein JZU63_00675 [Rhodoferax sp.]|nr:hypothetical protein [Rhodoferax sp.]